MSEEFKQRLQDLQNMQQGISPAGTTDTVYYGGGLIGGDRYYTEPGIFDVGGPIKFYSLSPEEQAKAIRDTNKNVTNVNNSFFPSPYTPKRINPNLVTQQNTNGLMSSTSENPNNSTVDVTKINNNQNAQENIFGERLAQALFPGIGQNNKGLIDAAILRGSLELLKPRQAGENLASQLGRGLEAGVKVGEDVQKRRLEALTTQAALLKAQQAGKSQVSISKEKREAFQNVIDPLFDSDPTFRANIETLKQQTGDSFGLNDDTRRALELEAMTINAETKRGAADSMRLAVQNFLSGSLISNQSQAEAIEDKFAGANRLGANK